MGASGSGADLRGDTIAAVATAAGRAALAVVRLSGPDAPAIAARVGMPRDLEARAVTRARLHQPDRADRPIDDALVTRFAAPRSYTGEPAVEFSVHGGAYVSATLLAALVAAGARPALPGEFTERALRRGKLGLLEAEAIADLIDARSAAAHRAALRQLDGLLTRRLAALREALLDTEALIAYEIDFPEEDDGPQPRARATAAANRVRDELAALLATRPQAELGREGVVVVLAGAPNAGKSSLFNALAGAPRAIVSAIPGTTRDAIEVLVDDDPLPIRFVDTAGLRDSTDALEQLGVEVSRQRLAAAHAVLVCAEEDAALTRACTLVAQHTNAPRIAVRTKSDLRQGRAWTAPTELHAERAVAVSATTGEGLDTLRAALREVARALVSDPLEEHPMVTRARHAQAIEVARAEVDAFIGAWTEATLPAPVAATHLRAAVHALDELLGGIDTEEIMGRVFRMFCVGK
jgi:tRNA modification GTPase